MHSFSKLANRQDKRFSQNPRRPKVSAVRSFPEGCGVSASKVNSKESEDHLTHPNSLENKTVLNSTPRKYPPRRILKGVSVRRDFPVGCGSQSSDHSFHLDNQKMSIVVSKSLEEVYCRIEPLQVYGGVEPLHVYSGINSDREKVKETLSLFHESFIQELAANSGINKNGTLKVLMQVVKLLQMKHKCINTGKRLGSIPGVEVGDKFQWMAELYVIGLHLQFFNGIDFTEMGGNFLATSVVDSGRYANDDVEFCDVLIYSGHGGNPKVGNNKELEDQKLERGNLALKNSMEARTPVRVIRGFKKFKSSDSIGVTGRKISNIMYVYDGLYFVDDYWQERGPYGKLVFKFLLRRKLGQNKCNWEEISGSKQWKIQKDDIYKKQISLMWKNENIIHSNNLNNLIGWY